MKQLGDAELAAPEEWWRKGGKLGSGGVGAAAEERGVGAKDERWGRGSGGGRGGGGGGRRGGGGGEARGGARVESSGGVGLGHGDLVTDTKLERMFLSLICNCYTAEPLYIERERGAPEKVLRYQSFRLTRNLLNEGIIGILWARRFIICSTHTDSKHMASQISGTITSSGVCYNDKHRIPCKLKGLHCVALNCLPQEVEVRKWMNGYHIIRSYPNDRHRKTNAKSNGYLLQQGLNLRCRSYGSRSSNETKECNSPEDANNPYRDFDEHPGGMSHFSDSQVAAQNKKVYSTQGLSKACQFVYNDAKFVNERAQSDILLLSRGITRLNKRASKDVAVLGLGFLKLDARARKDTRKIDNSVKERAAHLTNFARIMKERAHSDLKKAADQHWSDGALEADLRRADLVVRRRAMEDAFMALKFIRDIHDMMATKLQCQFITLEKNGKILKLFPREVSTDQIAAIEDAYLNMASALSEADGIDYTNPEELELLVAALIDLDAMDGKKSVSLIAECSSSPDVNTRKALANALAAAPSMWTLGNAGMGALQRLAQDSNPAVASSAARAIGELRKQWELEEGDSLRFVMNQNLVSEETDDDS